MQTQFEFDAEGVFDQPIRPVRIRKRKQRRKKWISMTEGSTLERRAIRQTMRCPKLLSGAMPRVILKEKYLQRPRSPESEFGLTFKPPSQRKELAEFIGCSAAAGIVADVAEAEFFRTKRRDSLGGFGKKNAIKRY